MRICSLYNHSLRSTVIPVKVQSCESTVIPVKVQSSPRRRGSIHAFFLYLNGIAVSKGMINSVGMTRKGDQYSIIRPSESVLILQNRVTIKVEDTGNENGKEYGRDFFKK